jgi:hypothetical protein
MASCILSTLTVPASVAILFGICARVSLHIVKGAASRLVTSMKRFMRSLRPETLASSGPASQRGPAPATSPRKGYHSKDECLLGWLESVNERTVLDLRRTPNEIIESILVRDARSTNPSPRDARPVMKCLPKAGKKLSDARPSTSEQTVVNFWPNTCQSQRG